MKDAVTVSIPPDDVRHTSCSRFLEASETQKSSQVCQPLKYYLTSRKRKYNSLTSTDRLRRQTLSSTV